MKKKTTLSDLILLGLEKTVDGYIRLEDFAYHHYRYRYGPPELKKSSLAQAIRRLRINGYIDLEEYNNKLIVKLTDKGKSEALIRKILQDEQWDGKWRIVIWDIPEKHRKIRDIFRSKLKTWGFVSWQKSVWVSKKQITDILRDFIKEVGAEKWVSVIESSSVDPLQVAFDRK